MMPMASRSKAESPNKWLRTLILLRRHQRLKAALLCCTNAVVLVIRTVAIGSHPIVNGDKDVNRPDSPQGRPEYGGSDVGISCEWERARTTDEKKSRKDDRVSGTPSE